MAELAHPFICDVCGIPKREGNHWFRVWCSDPSMSMKAVGISAWANLTDAPAKHFHCCGEEHALRKAAELLGKISG